MQRRVGETEKFWSVWLATVCKEVGLLQEQKRLVQLDTIGEVGENSGHRQQQQPKKKNRGGVCKTFTSPVFPPKNQ